MVASVDTWSSRGVTRGLAVAGDVGFVGESWHRDDAPEVEEASVAVVDLREWQLVGRIPLGRREVRALAFAPTPLLEGLRTGFRVNPSRVLEQDQRDLFRQAGVEPVRIWANGDPLPSDGFRIRLLRDRLASRCEPARPRRLTTRS